MYFLLDIGGTTTRVAISKDGKKLDNAVKFPTPQSYEEGIDAIERSFIKLTTGSKVLQVAVGIAGPLDETQRMLVNAPNLPEWVNKPLAERLEEELGSPVYLENDAALGGLGEAVYGAAQDHTIVMYMTFSTGVGGARIVDRKVDVSTFGFEPGHQYIDLDISACPECSSGTLHEYVAGKALEHRVKGNLEGVTDAHFWHDIELLIATGAYNSILHWSPSIVVLGGGLVHSHKVSIERIQERVEELLYIFPDKPRFSIGGLGDDNGLWGALAVANDLRPLN